MQGVDLQPDTLHPHPLCSMLQCVRERQCNATRVPCLVSRRPSGLYFGLGQGSGALVGGLLKQRYGGQAMFALCACIVAAAWAACFAAERVLAGSDPAGTSSDALNDPRLSGSQPAAELARGGGSSAASGISRGRLMRVWRAAVDRLPRAWWPQRQQRLPYVQLRSKDSGPDLAVVGAVL